MRIFGFKVGRETANASVAGTGDPKLTVEVDQSDELNGLNLSPNPGPSHQKLTLSRKNVPSPDQHEALIRFIKQVRSQFRIRKFIEEYADQVTNGLRFKGTPEVQRLARNTNLRALVNKIVVELRTIGWCVVYVSEVENQPISVSILHNVVVKKSVAGTPIIYLQLSEEAKDAIRNNPKYYPKYWIKDLDSDPGINITRIYSDPEQTNKTQGGAYFIRMEPDGEDIFPVPPIFPLLQYVMNSEKILDGVSAMIDMLKIYLIHVKLGNELGQDLRDGRPRAVSADRISKVINYLSAGYKAGAIVTPGDVSIEHKFLNESPYAVHTAAIDSFNKLMVEDSGLPAYESISSEGVAAFIAKRMLPTVDKIRGILEDQFIRPFFEDHADIPGADTARVTWSNLHMFELKTLIDKAKLQLSTGGCSISYLNELLDPDYDFDAQIARKTEEKKNADIIGMIWEASQGISDKAVAADATSKARAVPAPDPNADQGGRPTN